MEIIIEGKKTYYTKDTVFLVQTSRGNGTYRTKYSFAGDPQRAILYYNAINITAPYNKRIASYDLTSYKSVWRRKKNGPPKLEKPYVLTRQKGV